MRNKFSKLDKNFVDGSAEMILRHAAAYEQGNNPIVPLFRRYVVIDTIFDPTIVDDNKAMYYQQSLGVSNYHYAKVLPRNSIVARPIITGEPGSDVTSSTAMFLFPFFPSTLAMPCQPGEHVWVIFENPNVLTNDLGYWVCRITEPGFVDDVNHTHSPRALDPTFFTSTKDAFNGTTALKYEFRNGRVQVVDGARYTDAETATIDGPEDVYETLISSTDASHVITYEPVPRFRKRAGDMALEGSNNTLIVLGKDRSGKAADVIIDDSKLPIVSGTPISDVQSSAGAIDIVAGRGQTEFTGGKHVESSLITGEPTGFKEIGKSTEELVPNEGDPDFINDRSRMYVAQKTYVDSNLSLGTFNAEFSAGKLQGASVRGDITDAMLGTDADGAIVVKSDKLRLIARSDVEILVSGIAERDIEGRIIASTNTDGYAAIVIKANGDIVLRPAKNGYIKLGGDDATRGIMCTDEDVSTVNGIVQGKPLITTMGGQVCGSTGDAPALSKGQGRLAAKVLIK